MKKPEETVRSPGIRVIGSYELPNVGERIQTQPALLIADPSLQSRPRGEAF